MDCDCYELRMKLAVLSEEILHEVDRKMQLKKFRQFLRKHNVSTPNDGTSSVSCSVKICSALAINLHRLSRRGIAVSTIFVDLMAILLFDDCVSDNVQWLCDSGRTVSLRRELETFRVIGAFRWNLNSDFMKLLLNFGFITSLPAQSPHLIEELEIELDAFITDIIEDSSNIYLDNTRKEAMELIKSSFYRPDDPENYKRIYFAVVALRAIALNLMKLNEVAEKCISCLRMYFTGTQDVYISVCEVKNVLYALLLLLNKLELFDVKCQEFHKLMPESPATTEPRKLAHLTRIQIRQNLKMTRFPLPTAVDKLFLPKVLKSFLLGEMLDIPSEERMDIAAESMI